MCFSSSVEFIFFKMKVKKGKGDSRILKLTGPEVMGNRQSVPANFWLFCFMSSALPYSPVSSGIPEAVQAGSTSLNLSVISPFNTVESILSNFDSDNLLVLKK